MSVSKIGRPAAPLSSLLHINTQTGCWEWIGRKDRDGYGRTTAFGGVVLAHRALYSLFRGAIPTGLSLDHLCRVRNCVNPWHLEAVSMRENTLRGNTIAAAYARRTHCVHGHPLSNDNLTGRSDSRQCRTCWLARCRESNRRYYQKKKAEKRRPCL